MITKIDTFRKKIILLHEDLVSGKLYVSFKNDSEQSII